MIALIVILAFLFFPWRLETGEERRPWATGGLAILLVGLHAVIAVQAHRAGDAGMGSLLQNWFTYGLFPAGFQPHMLFSAQLLHADLLHLLGNAWLLWVYGQGVERRIGPLLLLGLVFGTGAFAHLGWLRMAPDYLSHIPTIGASSGIAGILGFVLLAMPSSRVAFLTVVPPHRLHVPAFLPLGLWFGGQLFAGFATIETETLSVNHWVHVYGFIAGVLCGLAWRYFVGSRDEVAVIRETSSLEEIARLVGRGETPAAQAALDRALAAAAKTRAGIGTHLQVERARIAFLSGRHADGVREAVRLCEDLLAVKAGVDFLHPYLLLANHAPNEAARPSFLKGAGQAYAEAGNGREALRCWMRLLAITEESEAQERLLFQSAQLLAQKMSRPDAARGLLRAQLAAWPTGKLAKEAEFLLTRRLGASSGAGTPAS